jgi:2-polyprenyl-3-methyl-5-hydroxy-6-metoxy-1,4-benzoquinol methylase
MPARKVYNTTQLSPAKDMDNHIYHRDTFAHYMRWTHALKHLKRGMRVLDFGCGSGEFAEVIWRNKLRSEKYLGYDIRETQIEKNKVYHAKQDWIHFEQKDLVTPITEKQEKYDLITSFEVIEHIGKYNGEAYLDNLSKFCDENTTVLLSTPCYNVRVGAAANHMIWNPETQKKEVGEFTYEELETLLSKRFTIEKVYGTFASQIHYEKELTGWQKEMYENLKPYFDVNILANLMAPMNPKLSRNCIWRLKLKSPLENIKFVIDE